MIEMLTLLVAGHFLADFGLQNDFVAQQKGRALKTAMGFFAMTAHAAIHGLITALIFSWFGHEWGAAFWSITVTHWMIDYGKCRGWFGIVIDQALHIIALTVVTFLIVTGV